MSILAEKSRSTQSGSEPATRSVYVETFGCQMNKSDSEHLLGLLDEIGYEQTLSIQDADLMVLNTCAIRGGAEDKMFSYLGRWRELKDAKPGTLIAVGGCVAQDEGKKLFSRAPYIDIVFGTHNLHRLPELVIQRQETGKRVAEVFQELPEDLPELPVIRQNDFSAWVSVIYGCDYNCTYCIVPYVRGREKSRAPQEVLKEVKELAVAGFKEVTLLGQNVTAYGHDLEPKYHLGTLIEMIGEVEGIKRIRFITGHPRDLTPEIIDSVAKTPTACEYFHIPMQAGDDRTLRRMARGYLTDFYRKRVEQIRERIPDAAITSDFIVGFPGETQEEFLNTVRIIEELGFDHCNSAAYSPRPHTPSANWADQVPEEEKFERLRLLNTVIGETSHKANLPYLDRTVDVLVEGKSAKNPNRMTGRTRTNKLVNFDGTADLTGQIVDVKILAANPWALRGELL
jgi:tRNA-N(6)-(isopentenyl)adenosine-37 thiotransferase enzyme MiaB